MGVLYGLEIAENVSFYDLDKTKVCPRGYTGLGSPPRLKSQTAIFPINIGTICLGKILKNPYEVGKICISHLPTTR